MIQYIGIETGGTPVEICVDLNEATETAEIKTVHAWAGWDDDNRGVWALTNVWFLDPGVIRQLAALVYPCKVTLPVYE